MAQPKDRSETFKPNNISTLSFWGNLKPLVAKPLVLDSSSLIRE